MCLQNKCLPPVYITNKISTLQDEAPCSKNILTGFQKTADDMMVRKYTPAGVVVNESMDIEHFRGRQVKDFGIGISTKDQKKYLKDFSG